MEIQRDDSTLAVISTGLGIAVWDHIYMFPQEINMLSTLSQHPVQSLCFVVLRYACSFSFATSVAYIFTKGSLCHAFLISIEMSRIIVFFVHSVVLFFFPTSYKGNRKGRIIALSLSLLFFVAMLLCSIISLIHNISHNFQDQLHCEFTTTSHWELASLGALILLSVVALLHFLHLGFRERLMRPYLLDLACVSFITFVIIVVLVVMTLSVSSGSTDFILREYIVLVIAIVDTRLLLKRARESESENIRGIPLPILDSDSDEGLTMETASTLPPPTRSQARMSRTGKTIDFNPRRTSVPFQRYDLYSYYSPTRLDDLKSVDYPVVNREVVVATE